MCPDVTFCTTNLTWTSLEFTPSLRSESLANNHLSYGAAQIDLLILTI